MTILKTGLCLLLMLIASSAYGQHYNCYLWPNNNLVYVPYNNYVIATQNVQTITYVPSYNYVVQNYGYSYGYQPVYYNGGWPVIYETYYPVRYNGLYPRRYFNNYSHYYQYNY